MVVWPLRAVRQVEGSFPGEPVRLARAARRLEALSINDRRVLDALRAAPGLSPDALLPPDGRRKLLSQAACAALALIMGLTWAHHTLVPRLAATAVAHIPRSADLALRRRVEGKLKPGSTAAQALGISRIMGRLLRDGRAASFPYRVEVLTRRLDDNASAHPGGLILVNQGALEASLSAEELAGTLAHEIAHVELRHGVKDLLMVMIAAPMVAVLSAADAGPTALLHSAYELGDNRNSREIELEAERARAEVVDLRARALDRYAHVREQRVDQDLAGHVTRSVGREKNSGTGQLGYIAKTPHWRTRQEFLPARRLIKQLFVERRAENAGCDRVDVNAMLCPFDRK